MRPFDVDDAVYEKRIFFLQHYLRSMIFITNEIITIGSSIGRYETALDIIRRNGTDKKSLEFIEMADRYKKLILALRDAEEFIETGVHKR